MNPPVYVVGPAGPLEQKVVAALSPPPEVVEAAAFVTAVAATDAPPPPGVVLLLADELPPADTLAVIEALARGDGEWTPCLVRQRDGGEPEVRTVSVGYSRGLEDVTAYREGDDDRLLELRRSMKRISRSRHDVNNPLTSALAETQLLLMDVEEAETREGLETIQTQLRRIRDLVAETGGLRPGRD